MSPIGIVLLLLSLGGFGVDANPNALAPKEVLRLSPKKADYMVHIDLVGLVPNNYEELEKLPNNPQLAKSTEAAQMVSALVEQVRQGRLMAQTMVGIDPVNDLHSVTAWLEIQKSKSPNFLIVIRGNFPKDFLEKIAGLSGKTMQTAGKSKTLRLESSVLAGITSSGELLVGSDAWVKPRIAKSFRRRGTSALSEGASGMLRNKPTFFFASAPQKQTLKVLEAEIKDTDLRAIVDLAIGHKFLGVSMQHNGLAWTVQSNSKGGHQRALQASHGTIALLRASHHGIQGISQLILSALPSYEKHEPVLATILEHNADVVDLVMAISGDGTFKVAIKDNPRKRTVEVQTTGKELKDVFPAGLLIPFAGAAGFLL